MFRERERERERERKELIPWGEKKQRKEELCKESVRTFRLALRPSLSLLHSQFLSFFFSLFLFLFIFCISHANREKLKKKKKKSTVFLILWCCCSKFCKKCFRCFSFSGINFCFRVFGVLSLIQSKSYKCQQVLLLGDFFGPAQILSRGVGVGPGENVIVLCNGSKSNIFRDNKAHRG